MGIDKSIIFQEYNQLRGVENVEPGRLNRALGYAQSKTKVREKLTEYQTTMFKCTCPDRRRYPYRPCKHMLTRRMQIGDRDWVLIKFWGRTYGPDTLLEPGVDLYMRVAEVVDGNVEVATKKHPLYRRANLPALEVFEYLTNPENGLEHVYTALVNQKSGRDGHGWHGCYELAFVKTNPTKE